MEVDELLRVCVARKASDLHIHPGLAPTIRVDGILSPIKKMHVFSADEVRKILYGMLTQQQREQFERERVFEFAYANEVGHFRVSIYHQMRGVAGAFRVIPQRVPTLDELGLPAVLKKLLLMSRGLILAAGPTGSGKSTSLAAMIDFINTYRICNIITIEDPIEFVFEPKRSIFNQIQVGRDAVDFQTALRSALRQDPDVIMLGELRDLETMRLALSAVETGHLVLATIHAGSAPLAVSRFADVFPNEERNQVRTLLSETLEAVVCQRLIRKSAGGRIGLYETMVATIPVRHYIRQGLLANIESSMQTGGDKGMLTFDVALDRLVKRREITPLVAASVLSELKSANDFIEMTRPI